MSAEVNKEIQLEIGHLLFIDVVGYSKLLVNEQIELMQELNRIVRGTECFRDAEASGKLIRLPTGDGMVLLFFAARNNRCVARWKSVRLCAVNLRSSSGWEFTAVRSIRWLMSMTK